MKTKFLLLTLVASIGIGMSSFEQQRNPQSHPKEQHKNVQTIEVRYYYLPEYNAYFDTRDKVYYYKKKNKWIKTSKPTRINKNIAQAKREPIQDLKSNELPYTHNAQHVQTWKGQQNSGRR